MKSLPAAEIIAQLKSILENSIEADPIPGKIKAFLLKHDGKKLTKREEKKMQAEIDSSIYFRLTGAGYFTTFYICWGGRQTGIKLTSSNVDMKAERTHYGNTVNVFDDDNAAYFSAADARNEQRRKAIADETALAACAEAIVMMTEAKQTLKSLFSHGEPLSVEQFTIEKAFDLRDR